jgi:hypothetical protein
MDHDKPTVSVTTLLLEELSSDTLLGFCFSVPDGVKVPPSLRNVPVYVLF